MVNINLSRFGTPTEVIFCNKCVISNQRPNSVIEFRSEASDKKDTIFISQGGTCQACEFAEIKDKSIDWEQRKQDLHVLCDRFRAKKGYDVVVPGSGGKDSAYASHILKSEFGMNPLTVTWAPHLYTDIGWSNFQNWIHVGGLDNILYTPNGKLHRILTREAFVNLLHPFQPFIVGQKLIGPKIAAQMDIPLIFYGENQAEYGNKIEENLSPVMEKSFYVNDGEVSELRLGGKLIQKLMEENSLDLRDFSPYLPLTSSEARRSDIEVHYLGYYLKWDPQECFYYAARNTGFRPNSSRTEGSYSKYSSIDDKIDPFHYFTTLIKFGIGRATYDAAQEIRNGKISRDEGINLVRLYDCEFPNLYFDNFLHYIGLKSEEFWQIIDSFRPEHLWEKVESGWQLRNPVWKS
jgi:N-acetyl sugar amidotransferase